ncbi:MAG: hypothetical protein J6Y24_07595, partial [Bacteroidales bacterium]|nr:hypothetical protein [Bacteroidales bacterium]
MSDIVEYLTEEPKSLYHYSYQKIGKWPHATDLGPEKWEHKFIEEKERTYGTGIGWDYVDHGKVSIFNYGVRVSYEIFRCESGYAGKKICPGTELNFKYSFELPFHTSVYLVNNNNTKKLLKVLTKDQTEFTYTVSNEDITDFIGFNEPFDIRIMAGSDKSLFVKPSFIVGITHFQGIKDYVQFEKPYIKDNTVVIPDDKEGLNKNCNFILSGKTISQAYNAPNQKWIPEGKYQLQISDKNDIYCQVNLDAYVPKVEYNYLDDAKQHTHWHSKDYIQAINMKMYNDGQEYPSIDINPDSKYTNNFECIPGNNNEIKKDPIVVYNDNNAVIKGWDEKEDPIFNTYDDLYATPYYISCNPDLDSIIIVPNDIKHSIYTIISTQNVDDEKEDDETDDDETDGNEICKLKEYPPITVDFLEDKPAHCSYDTLKVNIKSITGGLTDGKLTTSFNDFKYQLKLYNTNNEEIPQPTGTTTIPEDGMITIPDDGIIDIPNYNHKEYKYTLQFYDANISDEDAEHGGKEARSFTTSEKQVVMPEALFIPAPSISHPLCTFDSNGSIAINTADVTLSYPGKTAHYTWSVIKGDEKNQTTTSIGLGPTISDLPAGFYQVELNNDNCIATGSYELIDPPLLKFEWVRPSDAKCYGYSDGSIFTSVVGGTEVVGGTDSYIYSWNVGATSKDLLNIPKGDYLLTVLDAHECKITTDTIKISEPTEVINTSIVHDYSICQDSELEIDAGSFADYIWKNPQGDTLDAKSILTLNNASPEGEYYLKTIRDDNCFAEDLINITQSKESLTMNFLLPSDIYNDDHAKIVETSSHELDSLKWTFSENLIGDFPKDSTTLTISTNALDKLSTYKIKLTGYYKG